MAIEAELADGRILEFPDGTNPAVIQATVKRMVGQAPSPQATPAPVAAAPAKLPTREEWQDINPGEDYDKAMQVRKQMPTMEAQAPAPTPTPVATAPTPTPAPVAPTGEGFFDKLGTGMNIVRDWATGVPVQTTDKSVLEGKQIPQLADTEANRRAKVEADRLVAIGAAKEAKAKAAREKLRTGAAKEDYGVVDFYKDTGLDAVKGTAQLGEAYVGLLDLTSGGAAGRVLSKAGYSPKGIDKFLTGFQSITRQDADANVEEAKGFLNTLKAMAVNPTSLVGTIVQSLPSTVASGLAGGRYVRFLVNKATGEAASLGLAGAKAESFITQKVRDQAAKIAAVASGTEGAQTAGLTAEAGRQAGKDWNEYVLPALAAGFGTTAIGVASGKVGQKFGIGDIETSIAARSAGVKGIGVGEGPFLTKFLKEVGKEGFLEELPQSAQEQIFQNLATGRPWDEGIGKAAAQGLVAGLAMAGGHSAGVAALQKGSETLQEALTPTAPENLAETMARERGFLTPEGQAPAVAPTAAEVPVAPTAAEVPVAPTAAEVPVAPAERETKIKKLASSIEDSGVAPEDALTIATQRVAREEAVTARQQETAANVVPTTPLPTNRAEEITQEFIAAGFPPEEAAQRAQQLAQQEAEYDAGTEAGAGEVVAGAGAAGAGVAEQPVGIEGAAELPGAEQRGVVPTGPAAEGAPVGEGEQPRALTATEQIEATGRFTDLRDLSGKPWTYFFPGAEVVQERFPGAPAKVIAVEQPSRENNNQGSYTLEVDVSQHPDGYDENGDRVATKTVRVTDEELNRFNPPVAPTQQGAPSGIETPEAVQAKAQEQEAGAAPTPTVGEQAKAAIAETKKPRGRPKLALTPEQTAAKVAAEKKADALRAQGNRAVTRISPKLESAIVNSNKVQKRTHLRELLELEPLHRGTPLGKRIKALLANPRITAEEIASVKREIAEAQPQTLSSIESAASQTVADPKFGKFTNGAQAISHIIKTGDAFQQRVGKLIRGFVNGVQFVVLEKDSPIPARLQSGRASDEWAKARAMYVRDNTGAKIIYVRGASFGNSQGTNNVTVLHELLHAATSQKLRLGLLALKQGFSPTNSVTRATVALQRVMENAKEHFDNLTATGELPEEIQRLKDHGSVFTDINEFLAYGMSDKAMQEFLLGARGERDDVPFMTRFVTAIRDFFGMGENETNALTDLIVGSEELIRAQKSPTMKFIERQEKKTALGAAPTVLKAALPPEAEEVLRTQKEIDKDVDVAIEKFVVSKSAEDAAKSLELMQIARNPKKSIPALKLLWKSATNKQREILVKLPTMEFLVNWANTAVPELRNTYELMQKMSGMTQTILRASGLLTTDIHRAFLEDSSLKDKLDKIAITSTIAQVDPSDPTSEVRSAKLDAQYKALGYKGQKIFKRIKNHFENLSELYSKLLDDQIIESSLSAVEKANLMVKLRKMYETAKKISPYFPLVRRGDYWFSAGSGKSRQFYMFESMAERDLAMQAAANRTMYQKPGESAAAYDKRKQENLEEMIKDEHFGIGNDINSLRRASFDSSELLRGVFDTIDNSKFGEPDAKEALKDSIYQIYLNTMPEQSFRNQFINRKNTTGFSTDLLRNVSTTTVKMATQLARIKYAPKIRNSLSAARDSIAGRPENEPFVTEMDARASKMLGFDTNTVGEQIAGLFNKASFFFYLGGASSALLQPISVFQTGMPVLAGRYGTVNATREMSKMLKFWSQYGAYKTNPDGTRSWVAPTIEHAKGLTADERKAVRGMTSYGVAESTFARALYEQKGSPTEKLSGPKVQLAKDAVGALVLGGLMHSAERISREMMYLTSFRLNMKKHGDYDRAVREAVNDTNEALGNYGAYNRPRFMQASLGKVLTQFMMYPLQTTMFLINNLKQMVAPMDGRTRGEAAVKFFGTMGTTFILAGAIGLPLFSTIMGLLGVAWKELDDKDELPANLKGLSFQLWFRTVFLPEQLGDITVGDKKLSAIVERGPVNAFTGLDIGGRTGLDNLWMRDNKEHKNVREEIMALALERAGPGVNMLLSFADAGEAFANGDYKKGTEKMLPSGFRNFVAVHKYSVEGAKDVKGAQIMSKDAFTTGELIGQSIGFRPDLLANTQYVNFKVSGLEQRINNERTQLMNNLDREFSRGNNKEMVEVIKDINKFNNKFPSYEISEENITDSLEKRAEQRGSSFKGVVLTEKNVPVFIGALSESRKELAEREQKGKK